MNIYREDNDEERLENLEELLQSIKLYEEDNREEEDMSPQHGLRRSCI